MTTSERYLKQSNASPERQLAALARKIPADTDGCWPWSGSITRGGYGLMRIGPKSRDYVHRVSYRLHVGPIPDGYQIDHLCRNRACFNPAHLEAVPPRVNWIRGMSPTAQLFRSGKCAKGLHDMTTANSMVNAATQTRRCRACNLQWQRDRRKALSAPTPG